MHRCRISRGSRHIRLSILSVESAAAEVLSARHLHGDILGYVGEISPKQLESERWTGFGRATSSARAGSRNITTNSFQGRPGYRKVIVDSRGRIQSEIEVVPPQAGQDLITTLDLDLQMAAERQIENSASKRGTILAMDPRNGEMLAMASQPSFDPNVFVQGSKTREGRKQIAEYWQDEERPLYNRAIQGRYPPGSTWKIPMSVGGFQSGAMTETSTAFACGGGILIGSKFTKCMGSHGAPTRIPAIPLVRWLLLSARTEDGDRRHHRYDRDLRV